MYLFNGLMTSQVRYIARHKIYLLLNIKYIEFKHRPKMLIEKPGLSKFSYDETDKRVSYQKLEKTNFGRLSVKVAKLRTRSNAL